MTGPRQDSCDVLLVYPRVAANLDIRVLPFGLLAIAASLRRAGFRPRVLDLNVASVASLMQVVCEPDLLYVGFTVFTGPMINEVLQISARIRTARPRLPLVWGGPHPTIMPELTAQHPLVDVVCRGEGERTAVRLARTYAEGTALAGVPGLTFRAEGRLVSTPPVERIADADAEMSLALDTVDLRPYMFSAGGRNCSIFLTSRGCPYRCDFCWNLMFHGRHYTAWSPEKAQSELQPLLTAGVDKILLFDSFLGPVSRVRRIGELFRTLGIGWAIEDGCRADVHKTDEFFRCLAETQCTHVAFGAESGSQRVLDMIHKDISVEDILATAEARRPYAISARYQWMTGIPGETQQDAVMTADLIDRVSRVNPRSAHSLELYLPYPGNTLFEDACRQGWQPPADLAGWGTFRWQGRYPFHKGGTWYFKAVQYSNFFYRFSALAVVSSFSARVRPVFRLGCRLLWPFAMVRWRLRLFRFPLEYWVAEWLRRLLER